MPAKRTVIDLFAGCGGLSLGLHKAGWKGLFAVEKNPDAFKTLNYNLIEREKHFSWPKWLPKEPHDINELLDKYGDELKSLQGKVDLVAGGPPCQGFSMAGKRQEKDLRNQLVFSYIKFIELVRPKILLFENVKGFTCAFSQQKGSVPYSSLVIDKLKGLDYDVHPFVFDFSNYGVPQRRKRFILIGVYEPCGVRARDFQKLVDDESLAFLAKRGLTSSTSVAEAIDDLKRAHGETVCPDRKGFQSGLYGKVSTPYQQHMREGLPQDASLPDSHSFARHGEQTTELFKRVIKAVPHGKRMSAEERKNWGIGRRSLNILDAASHAATLTSNPDDLIHYLEPRILTVREYARIQSFPDWYEFKAKYTTGGELRRVEVPRYTQIANAVPPLFAELAGLVLKKYL